MTKLIQPDFGSVVRETPVPMQTARSGPDALRALELESPKAVYSTVVLAGLVIASEWVAITLAGAVPYAAYIVPRNGPHPLYIAIACSGATAATLAFHAQRLYATLALRWPLGAFFRMAGAWTLLVLGFMAALYVLRDEDSVSRIWLAVWSALTVTFLCAGRFGLARFVEALARAGRLQRRAVLVGGGDLGDRKSVV
jgi:hypothetical protein